MEGPNFCVLGEIVRQDISVMRKLFNNYVGYIYSVC